MEIIQLGNVSAHYLVITTEVFMMSIGKCFIFMIFVADLN